MTDFQIQCFLYLAAYQSFTRAAEVLGITQPALTHQIAALEKRLGMELFKRTNRGVVLTPEGRIMHAAFKETEQKILTAIERARKIYEKNSSILYLGIQQDWRMDGFMGALLEKCQTYQDLFKVELRQLGAHDLLEALQEGSIDVALAIDNRLPHTNDLTVTPIIPVREFILYQPSLMPDPPETVEAFRDQTFILISQTQENEFRSDHLAAILGFRPVQTVIVNSAEAQYLSVKCGLGVSVISELSRNFAKEDLATLPTHQTSRLLVLSQTGEEHSKLIEFFTRTIASQIRITH